ncbi:DUF4376 domain-containing protein [Campylobacter jejuni]|uniref:DUF4376 domain-containing protein n=1 Tax=unclassified Campylobacter TaxID=2593542 RepID=UPI0008749CDD|nr:MULTISPECIES: DUF4376 domain-containing protein [unclassified Campylobacter]EAH9333993.1 DUF4376 domain-containing protein [Campylobacter jejuni]EAH9335681.1 DUF4376 domain-containing protein [Campylobacter jejuni]EAJ4373674.1 DUF4376 domain-containing protein [Campylobacter jejuni]EAJ5638809.1 DUF4376 domain-containing protein [Campylobacter jejuni]EAK1698945.1 DUF4376 domain-containing protein [Campylobacter jejuni]
MKYFIDQNNQIYAYEDEATDEQIKEGLTPISEEEFNALINPPKSEEELLNEAKELKINEINAKKENILNGGFSFKGKIYQSSNEDQLRINGAVTNALVNPNLIPYIDWIALDNTTTRFSVEEFKLFASSMAYFIQQTIFKAKDLKEKIRNATSLEELNSITWED